MKKTLRELLNLQIKSYETRILFFDKKINKYLLDKSYDMAHYYQTKKEQLLDILNDLKSL